MVLTRIKPSHIGFEMRLFQGVNCDHVDKMVTETKSMKWRSSGLRVAGLEPGMLRALDSPGRETRRTRSFGHERYSSSPSKKV
jgi:hypothetical protein